MSNLTKDVQTTNDLNAVLNTQLANWSLLGVKLHNYHWFVKGPQFFTLHAKFEELYNTAAGYVDEIAERMLAIGGKPAATMAEYLKLATIEEASGETSAEQMVERLVADFQVIVEGLKAGIESAGEQGDDPTADLMTGMMTEVEKQNWMLSAFLGK
ncbi:starvation-inducible DNA-binding protein [Paenibacillus uliginis N3/975]|uniref:Starvation-inducible DNA-binding protein n=1 Tax=Paenibacillus uliginis N3/975 TaxID=1313296 RepID=A0A1X7HPP4_9BACL|nr:MULTISPECIES: DNA starvation/stationary phase protection protein [Paenibacillus]UNK19726.1 DNA starvation/stationary phase protection protein [Paenibacillus sp. N3/727]SMF89548.1 starvation-inducible DNA-binding protein [Paenibacillus uliginis N3/975]